jgi:hypothetical protein
MSYQYASRNYYADERKRYSEAYELMLGEVQAEKILKKLNNHYRKEMSKRGFGYKPAYLVFRGWRDGGCHSGTRIRVSHNPSIGLLLHEFAHHAHHRAIFAHIYGNDKIPNQGTDHHGLHFDICLNHIHEYAKSKGYWRKKGVEGEKTGEKEEVQSEVAEVEKEVLDIAAGI